MWVSVDTITQHILTALLFALCFRSYIAQQLPPAPFLVHLCRLQGSITSLCQGPMKSQIYKRILTKLLQHHRLTAMLQTNSKHCARINTHTKPLAHQNTISLIHDYKIQIQLNNSHTHIHQNSSQAQVIQEILIRIILKSISLATVSHYIQNCVPPQPILAQQTISNTGNTFKKEYYTN
jgi:hypothetical protein